MQLVAFLEDRKVRALPVAERAPLRSVDGGWDAAFAAYLASLACPLPPPSARAGDGTGLLPHLLWLASHAVAVEYEDSGAWTCG